MGIAGFGDLHFTEHLTNDDLNVLVVDLNTLQAIDLLHFVDQVLLQLLGSADLKNFMRHHRTFRQLLPLLDRVSLVDNQMLREGDEMFLFRTGLSVLNNQLLLAAEIALQINHSVDLGDFRCVLRTAGFKELGHPR